MVSSRHPGRHRRRRNRQVRRHSLSFRLCALVAVIAAVSFASGGLRMPASVSRVIAAPCRSDAEPAALVGTLAAHNATRALATPAPDPPLPPMCWNASVAATAQRYADQCRYQHSGGSGLGENIYAHSADISDHAVLDAVARWSAEAADFSVRSNTCSGPKCGHYTQIVWRDTDQVGCGVSVCDRNSPFGSSFPVWTLVVCNYRAPGNVVGRRPY